MTLDYEMSVRNWFLNYVFARGYSLQGMEAIGDQATMDNEVTAPPSKRTLLSGPTR